MPHWPEIVDNIRRQLEWQEAIQEEIAAADPVEMTWERPEPGVYRSGPYKVVRQLYPTKWSVVVVRVEDGREKQHYLPGQEYPTAKKAKDAAARYASVRDELPPEYETIGTSWTRLKPGARPSRYE